MASRNASASLAGHRRPRATRPPIGVEPLEGRQLLSAGGSDLAAIRRESTPLADQSQPTGSTSADRTPPRLESAAFVFAGARRDGKPAGISLTFSEAIDPDTAQAGNVRLATRRLGPNGRIVSRPIRILDASYDQATHTLTLTPDRRAFFPRGARVAVLPGVTDLAGNGLESKAVVIIPRDLRPGNA